MGNVSLKFLVKKGYEPKSYVYPREICKLLVGSFIFLIFALSFGIFLYLTFSWPVILTSQVRLSNKYLEK